MKKAALIVFSVVCIFAFLSGQEYKGKARLFGTVFDQDGKPLDDVKVKLVYADSNTGFEVTTDKQGRWTGAWLRSGTWYIDFEKVGYETKKISVAVAELEKKPEIKINLRKAAGLVLSDEVKKLLTEANQQYEAQNYQAALAGYKTLLEKNPAAYIIWKNVGACYFAQEQYEQAEEAFKKVLEKSPDDTDAIIAVGNCYANRNQTEKAMEWYSKIEFEKINDPIVLYNIGNNYFKLSKFEEALKYLRRSVELQKDFLDGIYQLGLVYTSLQRIPDAVTTFEMYLKYDPDSPQASQVRSFLNDLKKK